MFPHRMRILGFMLGVMCGAHNVRQYRLDVGGPGKTKRSEKVSRGEANLKAVSLVYFKSTYSDGEMTLSRKTCARRMCV